MSELADPSEELRLAEERLEQVRAQNAELESRLSKRTVVHNRLIALMVTAPVCATLAYLVAGPIGDARAARS